MSKTAKTARADTTPRDDAAPNVTFIPGAVQKAKRKRRTRSWLWLPVVLAVAGAAYYGWVRYGEEPAAAAMVTDVVTRGDIENSGAMRLSRKTPAVTIVAAWIKAETGVGPAIASGSQT